MIYESEYWSETGEGAHTLGAQMTRRSDGGWTLEQFVFAPGKVASTRVLLVWSKEPGCAT
ncbi:MAG: hypothetical protein M3137_03240 [Actinomycetota bacterium]|nr:hypothetical protein [Actinomycetota bacterium]